MESRVITQVPSAEKSRLMKPVVTRSPVYLGYGEKDTRYVKKKQKKGRGTHFSYFDCIRTILLSVLKLTMQFIGSASIADRTVAYNETSAAIDSEEEAR